jgi:hypothetical protein
LVLVSAGAAAVRTSDSCRLCAIGAGSGGAAAEIESAKRLLDDGAISQTEHKSLKTAVLV